MTFFNHQPKKIDRTLKQIKVEEDLGGSVDLSKCYSQKETSIPTIHFQVRAVSFREGRCLEKSEPKEKVK